MENVIAASPQKTAVPAYRSKPLWREVVRHWQDYLCIAPFFVTQAVFFVGPILVAFVISFMHWNSFFPLSTAHWVGLDNYSYMLRDKGLLNTFNNVTIYAAVLIPAGLFLPLFVGVLLNTPNLRGRGLFRTLVFLPMVTSTFIIGIVFRFAFASSSYGWINQVLDKVGMGPYAWLTEGTFLPRIPVIILSIWGGLGFGTLIVLGGLQSIDQEVYEAAAIDGANGWDVFWRITLPLMRPVMLFLLIGAIQGTILMLGNIVIFASNNENAASPTIQTPMYYVYRVVGLLGKRTGDAAAVSFMMAAVAGVLSLVTFRMLTHQAKDQ